VLLCDILSTSETKQLLLQEQTGQKKKQFKLLLTHPSHGKTFNATLLSNLPG
jgi:hypothetical protein